MKFFEFLDRKGGFYYEVRQNVDVPQADDLTVSTAVGRRTRTQHRRRSLRQEGTDSLLQ